MFADDVQVKLMDAMKALSEARTAMVAVHNELNEAQLRLGVRTKMDFQKPQSLQAVEQVTARKAG